MKIIAIGLNYLDHIKEFGNPVPLEPVVFMKPDSALLKNNRPFYLPDFSDEIHYETEIIVRINRLGKNISEKFTSRYYDEIGVGIDFTARDLQREQRKNGNPWEICKAFDASAAVSKFYPITTFGDIGQLNFHLDINGKTVQVGNTRDMIFNVDKIITYVSRFFTLKIGDIIFTGTPVGVGVVKKDDHLQAFIEERKLLDFKIK